MNTKHTPGPWTADRGGCITDAGKVIATVQMGQQHNARLIAAAPELLAALALYVTDVADNGLPTTQLTAWEAARAAIAKAVQS